MAVKGSSTLFGAAPTALLATVCWDTVALAIRCYKA